jgi:hypothetical protein
VDYDSVWYMRQDSYQEHNTANQRDSLFLAANEGQVSRFLYHSRQPEAFYLLCQSERGSRILAAYEKHSVRDSFSQQGARSFTVTANRKEALECFQPMRNIYPELVFSSSQ